MRLARDLHDDLGSSLTEISVLASSGQRPLPAETSHANLFQVISSKARGLIAAVGTDAENVYTVLSARVLRRRGGRVVR